MFRTKIIPLLVICFCAFSSLKAQNGFKYKIINQYIRYFENREWSAWADSSSSLPEGAIVEIGTEKIVVSFTKGYKDFTITESKPPISNNSMYYSSYSCLDQNNKKCTIELTMKYNAGREITLLISYSSTFELRFSLKII